MCYPIPEYFQPAPDNKPVQDKPAVQPAPVKTDDQPKGAGDWLTQARAEEPWAAW